MQMVVLKILLKITKYSFLIFAPAIFEGDAGREFFQCNSLIWSDNIHF